MTPDELAAEIYSRQGYLVIASHKPEVIGGIISAGTNMLGDMNTPLIVKALSTKEEFMAQDKIGASLLGYEPIDLKAMYTYFYRVEAAD